MFMSGVWCMECPLTCERGRSTRPVSEQSERGRPQRVEGLRITSPNPLRVLLHFALQDWRRRALLYLFECRYMDQPVHSATISGVPPHCLLRLRDRRVCIVGVPEDQSRWQLCSRFDAPCAAQCGLPPRTGLPQRRPSFHLLRRRVRRARRPVSSGASRHKHFGLCWSQTGHSR